MTRSKRPSETPDALLAAASKDTKITMAEFSEEELKGVFGGVSLSFAKMYVEYKPQRSG
jgi:hypothetical protein